MPSFAGPFSTAYYGVFTALTAEGARPYGGDVEIAAMRLIDHGPARDVCETLIYQRLVPWLGGRPPCDHTLAQFAEDFNFLQLARHRADYDPAYRPEKEDARTAIDRAERALPSLEEARKRCPDQLQVVCLAMFASQGLRKRLVR